LLGGCGCAEEYKGTPIKIGVSGLKRELSKRIKKTFLIFNHLSDLRLYFEVELRSRKLLNPLNLKINKTSPKRSLEYLFN
jgi:hypothetical protein